MLGWVTHRHVPFSGSGGTLGIRVTGLLVILCGWSGVEGLDRQLACKQGCRAVKCMGFHWLMDGVHCRRGRSGVRRNPWPKLRDEASLRRGVI